MGLDHWFCGGGEGGGLACGGRCWEEERGGPMIRTRLRLRVWNISEYGDYVEDGVGVAFFLPS